MNYKAIYLTASCLTFLISSAQAFEICGDLKQGEIIIGKDNDAQEVIFNGKRYPVDQDGSFILAFGRNEEANKKISLMYSDREGEDFDLHIEPTKWVIQEINGLPQQKVTPDASNDAEIKRERDDVNAAFLTMEAGDYWREGFILPVEGRISGTFGNQRILNGLKKNPHSGVDIAAPEGTPVKASASGKVIQSGGNYFYTGNVVTLDHGNGLQTIYAHLKSADVEVGDIVKQGEIIGTVGKTGRVTGPHLHWGASLNNVRFRPHSLLEMGSKECRKI